MLYFRKYVEGKHSFHFKKKFAKIACFFPPLLLYMVKYFGVGGLCIIENM